MTGAYYKTSRQECIIIVHRPLYNNIHSLPNISSPRAWFLYLRYVKYVIRPVWVHIVYHVNFIIIKNVNTNLWLNRRSGKRNTHLEREGGGEYIEVTEASLTLSYI